MFLDDSGQPIYFLPLVRYNLHCQADSLAVSTLNRR